MDIWSVGCIFAEMFGSGVLFCGEHYVHQLNLILTLTGSPSQSFLDRIGSDRVRTYIRSLPHRSRLPLGQVFGAVESDGVDLAERMLMLDPAERISAADGLRHPYVASHLQAHPSALVPCPARIIDVDSTLLTTVAQLRAALLSEVRLFQSLATPPPLPPMPKSPLADYSSLLQPQFEEALAKSNFPAFVPLQDSMPATSSADQAPGAPSRKRSSTSSQSSTGTPEPAAVAAHSEFAARSLKRLRFDAVRQAQQQQQLQEQQPSDQQPLQPSATDREPQQPQSESCTQVAPATNANVPSAAASCVDAAAGFHSPPPRRRSGVAEVREQLSLAQEAEEERRLSRMDVPPSPLLDFARRWSASSGSSASVAGADSAPAAVKPAPEFPLSEELEQLMECGDPVIFSAAEDLP
jgi:serine/threonine protein kinase